MLLPLALLVFNTACESEEFSTGSIVEIHHPAKMNAKSSDVNVIQEGT